MCAATTWFLFENGKETNKKIQSKWRIEEHPVLFLEYYKRKIFSFVYFVKHWAAYFNSSSFAIVLLFVIIIVLFFHLLFVSLRKDSTRYFCKLFLTLSTYSKALCRTHAFILSYKFPLFRVVFSTYTILCSIFSDYNAIAILRKCKHKSQYNSFVIDDDDNKNRREEKSWWWRCRWCYLMIKIVNMNVKIVSFLNAIWCAIVCCMCRASLFMLHWRRLAVLS